MIKLAIDAMGGDFAPEITVKGAMAAIEEFSDLELVLYGDEEKIKKYLTNPDRITIVHSPKLIDMGEHDPITEIRRNKDTSMVMAFNAVKTKEVQGVVTAGPTRAVIVAAHMVIRRMRGMKRVALCPTIPSFKENGTMLLDVGANTSITPEFILQYAEYANIYAKEVKGIDNPKVYLLNIGAEEGKGRELEQATYDLLKNSSSIHFCGNLEPKEILTSDADIIITDGFTGNICMKTLEGTAKAMGSLLKKEIKRSLGGMIGAIFMRKNLKRFKETLSADRVGGATLFGVDGTVIKAHGSSNAEAFKNAIALCRKTVAHEVVEKMKAYLEEHPIDVE